MNEILKLIIDDYENKKPSAEYMLVLRKVCEAEEKFLSLLNKEQRTEYLKFEFIAGELDLIAFNDFAEYLFNFTKLKEN